MQRVGRTAPGAQQQLKRTLRRVFGHAALRPGQEEVIRAVMNGRDTLAVMPTGSGKSLCYQLPGLHLEGTTVVVSPLISLMKDQADKLGDVGIDASQLNSSLTKAETDEHLQRLSDGGEFVFTTPERLANDADFVAMLKSHTIDRFVIEEAHCVSQWGHDFRPAFTELKKVIAALGHPPVLALTATATPEVIDDIVSSLGLRNPTVINTGIYRSNLHLEVVQAPSDADKRLKLTELVRRREGTGIVYAATVKQVDAVEAELAAAGLTVAKYHGRLSARERHETQDRFIAGGLDAIVATNAFGMGIDKPDIRFVVHYAMPGSLEAYYQEAGRAGRDGEVARCVLLFNAADRRIHRYFNARGPEERRAINDEKLERMMAYAQSASCRWRALLDYFEEPDLDREFRCGTCDACAHPLEAQEAPLAVVHSPLAPREDAENALVEGQAVDVPEYGEGTVAALDGDKVEVAFADGAVRKFKASFVTPT